eukprot:scaffold395_cov243-Pinguiococcus_pyrenoidosus.AAC.34
MAGMLRPDFKSGLTRKASSGAARPPRKNFAPAPPDRRGRHGESRGRWRGVGVPTEALRHRTGGPNLRV